jgi:hypothetical protein
MPYMMRFEVLVAVNMKRTIVWDVTLYNMVEVSSSTPKMEAVPSSEMSVNVCHTTWRHIPEDTALHSSRYFKLTTKYFIAFMYLSLN